MKAILGKHHITNGSDTLPFVIISMLSANPALVQAFAEAEIFCGIDVVDVHHFPA